MDLEIALTLELNIDFSMEFNIDLTMELKNFQHVDHPAGSCIVRCWRTRCRGWQQIRSQPDPIRIGVYHDVNELNRICRRLALNKSDRVSRTTQLRRVVRRDGDNSGMRGERSDGVVLDCKLLAMMIEKA